MITIEIREFLKQGRFEGGRDGWRMKNEAAMPQHSCAMPRTGLFFGDLHFYDLVVMAWTGLSAPVSGTPPSPRYWHGFTTAEGRLYVHGGQGESGNEERWGLDVEQGCTSGSGAGAGIGKFLFRVL